MQLLACPICRTPLSRDSTALVCAQQHRFDLAREGYVNLFPAHHRQSRNPGDDERMVGARRRFIDAGHFAPLRVELAAALTAVYATGIGNAVDLGCGEGYFTDALASIARLTYGIDVSKAAIRAAAKRYPSPTFVVASSRRLPLIDGSFDAAMAILAPIDPDVVRILANGGVVVRVSPGPDHLRSLRNLVYAEVRSHRRATTRLPGVEHSSERLIRFTFETDRRARADLIAMTPMFHRTRQERRALALIPEHLTIEAGFWIDVFRKPN